MLKENVNILNQTSLVGNIFLSKNVRIEENFLLNGDIRIGEETNVNSNNDFTGKILEGLLQFVKKTFSTSNFMLPSNLTI